jgi:hypothetical protein
MAELHAAGSVVAALFNLFVLTIQGTDENG